ncbi:MAG TPA: hypothetical protein VGD68_17385, partial [Streptosporangiaceae bacterium]
MTAELISGLSSDGDPLLQDAPESAYYLVPPADRPSECAGISVRELFDQVDAEEQEATSAEPGEILTAGFWPRSRVSSRSRSGFGSGEVLDVSPPGAPLAGFADAATRDGGLASLGDDELIGAARAWQ